MKTIEIVAHAYAAKLPFYSRALTYMLSSLVLHEPRECRVVATICLSSMDAKTIDVVHWFLSHTDLCIRWYYLPPAKLGRRAIGRNHAAGLTKADIVWFADVDQVYRDGVLDRLAAMPWPEGATMIYPGKIKIHRDHATGDRAAELVADGPRLIDIDPGEFIDKRYNRAIGGVQIVKGNFAREHGYLDGDPRWQRPTGGEFASCRCDVPYRRFCGTKGSIIKVDLPGMYRLRHTVAGHGRPAKL